MLSQPSRLAFLAGVPTRILPGVRKIFRAPCRKSFLKKMFLDLFKVFDNISITAHAKVKAYC